MSDLPMQEDSDDDALASDYVVRWDGSLLVIS